jgi:hypothetical protein
VRKALVLAYGVHESGYREVIALDVGEAETDVLGQLHALAGQARPYRRAAGRLRRARWAEEGDRAGARLPLAALQRPLPRSTGARPSPAIADARRPAAAAFTADNGEAARSSAMRSGACRDRCRKVAGLLEEAEDDLLAFCCFPSEPGRSCGTNPTSGSTARSAAGAPTSSASSRRPLADPARSQRRDRTERRMARRPPLPRQPLTGNDPRSRKERQRQRGDPRAHHGLSSRRSCRRVTPRPGT